MNKKRILFIDDEPFFAEPYIQELEKSFEVILEETAIGAIDSVNSDRKWDTVILDIMMPSPENKNGITADGLDTGLWIVGEILNAILAQNTPLIIFTNRNIPRIQEFVDGLDNENDIPPGLIAIRSKIETPRFILPRIVKSAVDRFRPVT
jgi:CheY-like chemotaxis protein